MNRFKMENSIEQFPNNFNFNVDQDEVAKFWKLNNVYTLIKQKSVNKAKMIICDGPPFVSSPKKHTGHALNDQYKSSETNYHRMIGYDVIDDKGYDCHGLPVELTMNKDLNIHTRKEVEEYGIDKYNQKCKEMIYSYSDAWVPFNDAIGRFTDFSKHYKTMDTTFMESTWWVFKQLWEKGLIFKSYKVMPYSTACATPLSNFEASGDDVYKDVQDPAIYVKFELKEHANTFVVAWTTTPWTLPSNVALCMNEKVTYNKILDKKTNEYYIIADNCCQNLYGKPKKDQELPYEIVSKHLGSEFKNAVYVPLFEYYDRQFKIICDDFVTIDAGTGIVHLAPSFGEEDFNVCIKNNVVTESEVGNYCPIDDDGKFTLPVKDYLGIHVHKTNNDIMERLKREKKVLKKENYSHKYPFCWRTDTPLIYKAVSSYFIDVPAIKEQMIENNKKINWIPKQVGDVRVRQWLEKIKPWSISRTRFFGTPLPIWVSEDGQETVCVGSIDELVELAGLKERPTDLHREFVDKILIPSQKGKGMLRTTGLVFDCWFESGCVPYGQIHYPFENSGTFDNREFLSDLVIEGVEQYKLWFYTMSVLSTALFNKPAFKTAICTGMITADDGKKLSKRLGNYTDPIDLIKKYGSDACRMYLMNSPATHADSFKFCENDIEQVSKNNIQLLNGLKFFITHLTKFTKDGNVFDLSAYKNTTNVMDEWIIARLNTCIDNINSHMAKHKIHKVIKEINEFIEELTNWYIKFNRNRLKGRFSTSNEQAIALSTLYHVLLKFNLVIAPFVPFMSETFYQKLKMLLPPNEQQLSVHLCDYPTIDKENINKSIEEKMIDLQTVSKMIRTIRSKPSKFNVTSAKMPLRTVTICCRNENTINNIKELERYLVEEINVMNIAYGNPESFTKYKLIPNNKTLGIKYKALANQIKKELDLVSQDDIQSFIDNSKLLLKVNNTVIELSKDDVTVDQLLLDNTDNNKAVEICNNIVVIVDLTQDENVISYYLMRLFVVSVQNLRKQTKLNPWDKINIYYQTDSEMVTQSIEKHYNQIETELLYPVFNSKHNESEKVIESKEFNINDHTVNITITFQ